MRWYNRIFRRLGDRRLMTREEFILQVAYELASRDRGFMVMPRVKYRMLLEIAATASLLNRELDDHPLFLEKLGWCLPIQQRLQEQLMTFKEAENTPHSTNAYGEEVLMNIPGDPGPVCRDPACPISGSHLVGTHG